VRRYWKGEDPADRDPLALIAPLREELRRVDRSGDREHLRPRIGPVARRRAAAPAELLGVFAAIAVLLAAIGIYGVMAVAVVQRTREIGIRMALGAVQRDVLALVVRQGLALAGAGLLLGVAGALVLTRGMQSMLFSVSATDPAVFATIVGLLGAVSLLACYLPARRAARSPLVALRHE